MATETNGGFIAALVASIVLRRKVLMAGLVLAGLAWAAGGIWHRVNRSMRSDSRYVVSANSIHFTQQPPWIAADVCESAIKRASLQGPLSLLDSEQLCPRLAESFRLEPWIGRVHRVSLESPNRVLVDVAWRKPIAAVEVTTRAGVRLAPIDADAIRLPEQGMPEAALRELPRITRITSSPPVGEAWLDPQVAGGVSLVKQMGNEWLSLSLANVTPSPRPEQVGDQRIHQYELLSKGATRIVWGTAPNAPATGEAPFGVKLARLKHYLATSGQNLSAGKSPQLIDLRGERLAIVPRIAKKKKENRTASKPRDADSKPQPVK